VDLIENRLEVGARARDEDGDRKASVSARH
jgi:hypothetical protein